MLLAEIHGKTLQVARNSEDYLTSAVFGHLRYVPPVLFWPDLFAAAQSVPGSDGHETSLWHVLTSRGTDPARYDLLDARFWRFHPTLGEPDLLLLFTGGTQPPLVVLVEAKLWSGKSGTEERDQLVRYLGILDDLNAVGLAVPSEATRYLVYLTPRESLAEVEDSLAWSDNPKRDRGRLFRLRWQDVLVVARRSCWDAPEPARTTLHDVASFLGRLGLEYFNGFMRIAGLQMLSEDDGAIFRSQGDGPRLAGQCFNGFDRLPDLEPMQVRRARWAT